MLKVKKDNKMNEIIWSLALQDLQEEAQERLGEYLDEEEIERAKKLISYGLGEIINSVYDGVFEVLIEESKK
jgi:hypothetical protein